MRMVKVAPMVVVGGEEHVEPVTSRYSRAPLMAYWEMTRACDLACRHCRAEATPWQHPFELTTQEGLRLLDRLAAFAPKPHLVLTGGDPLKRTDVYWLISRATELGLLVSITPSGTPLLTRDALERVRDAGVRTVALSLDGPTARRHDRIRQVPGSFERTVQAARWARELGLSLQINSLVCAETVNELADIHHRVAKLGADRWSLFFLVTIGRGATLGQIDAYEAEAVLDWLYDLAQECPRPAIKTTEAHHYRRIALQRRRAGGEPSRDTPPGTGSAGKAYADVLRGAGIRDGAGILFISHTGEVYPSGFLPVSAGNIRRDDVVRLYQESPIFVRLRDNAQLKGKCGACEFKTICGGARSRAWAATGDAFAEDPLCVYQPHDYAAAAAS